jgi:stage II sporulation protein P
MFLASNYIKKLFIIVLILSIALFGITSFRNSDSLAVFHVQAQSINNIVNVSNSKEILKQAVPILGSNPQEKSLSYFINNPLFLIDLISELLINVRISNPVSIFDSELPLKLSLNNDAMQVISPDDKKRQAPQELELNFSQTEQSSKVSDFYSNVLLAIYHTHTSESYGVSVFNGHASPGSRGDIVQIGKELVESLKLKYGIKAVQSTAVNDSVYRRAYFSSRKVGQDLVRKYPNLKMVFDIHRDALAKENKELFTTKIDDQRVAKIMILVTRADSSYSLSHPNWRQNLKFAKRLAARMNKMYPGLLRKGKVKVIDNRRYNQDIHPHALLLEFGGVSNTLVEVKRSARLMADVIASLLSEELNE